MTAEATSSEFVSARVTANPVHPADPTSATTPQADQEADLGEAVADDSLRDVAARLAWAVETLRALDRLEPASRIVLVASYFDRHSQAEIAGSLDLPETAVASLMAGAMQQLATLLLPDPPVTR